MTKKEIYEKKTEEYILPILEEHQFELVDVEYVKEGSEWYLRAYIDKEGGIAVEDCAVVSRAMNEILDQEDYIEGSYIFEVSSPGLTRPLKKEKDFKRALNKLIEIHTYRLKDGCKDFQGILVDYDEHSVKIKIDEEMIEFEKTEIALIRMAFEV